MTQKATPFLMFDDQLGAALELYTSIFPDSRVLQRAQAGENGPVISAELVVGGQRFMAFNGGPHFRFTDAFSIFVSCEDQAEVDRYWDALVKAGAKPVMCGWITDPFGLSWQIVPKRFMELIADPSPAKSRAVMTAMRSMVKLDVVALEAAHAAA
ncbi:MAG: VOC family protein [Sandaracinaceae bacterium]|nr:VOC family protein [Sandaracinaceae bacterium]